MCMNHYDDQKQDNKFYLAYLNSHFIDLTTPAKWDRVGKAVS